MKALKSMVVGVDFSACSRSALEQAVRVAKAAEAHLHVVHVVEDLLITDMAEAMRLDQEEIEADAVRRARQELRAWLKAVGAPAGAGMEVVVGSAVDLLLQRVTSDQADLLVLGVRGESMVPWGAGTLAVRCLRQASTPVLLVQESKAESFRTVVACVDYSEQSRQAVIQALRLARHDGSRIHFVHVFMGSWGRYALIPDAWEVDPKQAARYRQALEQQLRTFVGETAGLPVSFEVVEAGNHGHGIAEFSRRVRADLIVMGVKGRTNLQYALLGSTVERLLKELPCSVLVVRSPTEPGGPA